MPSDEWQGLPFGDPSEVLICQLIQSDWIKIDVARISRQSGATDCLGLCFASFCRIFFVVLFQISLKLAKLFADF